MTTDGSHPRGLVTIVAAVMLGVGGLTLPGCLSDRAIGGEANGDLPSSNRRVASIGDEAAARSQQELQATLMGFADTYIALKSQAADNAALAVTMIDEGEPGREALVAQLRASAIRSKLDGAEAVVEIVTGPNANVALLDLAVMVTLEHAVWKNFWSQRFGEDAAYNMMDALERLEKEIWTIVGEQLSDDDVADLRTLAADIRERFITQVFVTSIRASQIARPQAGDAGVEAPSSLLSIMGIDPLAALSPAVREVTESRLLAERVYYYAQKAPTLIQWRAELLLNRSFASPELQGALAQVDSVTTGVSDLIEIAGSYPAMITAEREAALEQAAEIIATEIDRLTVNLSSERIALLEGVATERDAMLAAFDERDEELRLVLADARATAETATELSDSVGATIARIESLRGEPDPSAPPGRPFDIREYQDASESFGEAVRELNQLVASADQVLASSEWSERTQEADALVARLEGSSIRVAIVGAAAVGAALFVSLCGVLLVQRRLRGGRVAPAS